MMIQHENENVRLLFIYLFIYLFIFNLFNVDKLTYIFDRSGRSRLMVLINVKK